jgi:hypothetical protein
VADEISPHMSLFGRRGCGGGGHGVGYATRDWGKSR